MTWDSKRATELADGLGTWAEMQDMLRAAVAEVERLTRDNDVECERLDLTIDACHELEAERDRALSSEKYWREKYQAVVDELTKHTVVADGGQYRADVKESISRLAADLAAAREENAKQVRALAFAGQSMDGMLGANLSLRRELEPVLSARWERLEKAEAELRLAREKLAELEAERRQPDEHRGKGTPPAHQHKRLSFGHDSGGSWTQCGECGEKWRP